VEKVREIPDSLTRIIQNERIIMTKKVVKLITSISKKSFSDAINNCDITPREMRRRVAWCFMTV
jgi:DNA polymerase III gamma/tau subunit